MRFRIGTGGMSAAQGQLERRVGQITLEEIHEDAIVTRALPAEASLKSRAVGGSQDLAIPPHAPRDWFRSFRGTLRRSAHSVNIILVGLQCRRLKTHIQL